MTANTETEILDVEWSKFMTRINKQSNCEYDDDDDDNNMYTGDSVAGYNHEFNNNVQVPSTTSKVPVPSQPPPPHKRTCISKKQQRKTYSFIDTFTDATTTATDVAYGGSDDGGGGGGGGGGDSISLDTAPIIHFNAPKSTPIYISTKTKIAYLNKKVDIYNVFWDIPVIHYYTRREAVIKKQIKFQTTNPADIVAITEKLKLQKRYYEEQIIEHIDNPSGRIVFKDQRKVSIGLCKKDLLNNNSKKKRAFFNCFVLILRINGGKCIDESVRSPDDDILYKEMHVKVFNTGKLEIPGIQDDRTLVQVLSLLVSILRPVLGDDLDYLKDRCETVLINSNFNCGYFIDRDKLFHLMKYKYRINSNYDSCSYPGIQCKFYYIPGNLIQTGQQPSKLDDNKYYEVSFMIFRTGSILIVGKCNEDVLMSIYQFIKTILQTEFQFIQMGLVHTTTSAAIMAGSGGLENEGDVASLGNVKKQPKVRRKTIVMVGTMEPFIPTEE
jgi:hypothetical protein